ncbi:hypothetical protein [Shigella sonnei]
MKQMSLIEMDGFLKGKCIPSDLKVNETNAEYLVRKFAEAEAKCAALAFASKESEMDKNTPAYWSLSLDTECPKCGHNFDLLCDPDFWEFSGAKQACEEIKGYETCCPECNHEFKTDFVY